MSLTPAIELSNTENAFWHTELRAMKTAVAGVGGATCGEANLTHCGPILTSPTDPTRFEELAGGITHAFTQVSLGT